MWPDPDILKGGRPVSEVEQDVQDVRLELDLSRAGVTNQYGIKSALPGNIHIFVVGCGGNGGYVIPQVARYIRAFMDKQELASAVQRNRKKFTIDLTLIDGDDVEQKNLIRQNFINPDIGKNKAQVMAERYGRVFGLEVGIVRRYLNHELADTLLNRAKDTVVILGCVDNNFTRRIIHESVFDQNKNVMYSSHLFWIDVANEMFDGQLVIGYRHKSHIGKTGYGRDAKTKIHDRGWWEHRLGAIESGNNGLGLCRRGVDFPMPTFIDLFPDVLQEKKDFDPDDPSCAENTAEVEQAMATNIMSSSQMFSAFCQVMAAVTDYREQGEKGNDLERRPRAYSMNFGHGGRSSTKFNTYRNLTEIFVKEEENGG